MTECPECGAAVPAGGNFCPECGTRIGDARADDSATAQSGGRDDDWRSQEDEEWEYPVDSTVGPRTEDHKLLLGGVVALSLVGLVEGVVEILYADTIVEIAEEEFGIGSELAAEQLVIAGVFGVVIALAVVGATAYVYRDGLFRKAYFWGLIVGGVAGFLLAQSLFLTALAIFGIYGLVVVH